MPDQRMQVLGKPSQRQQIEEILQRAAGQPQQVLRARIPFSLYDHQSDNRNYVQLRDATWTMALPLDKTTPESVEQLISTLGACIHAIANEGCQQVLEKLAVPALRREEIVASTVETGEAGEELEG